MWLLTITRGDPKFNQTKLIKRLGRLGAQKQTTLDLQSHKY